ncbi:transmembrane protein 51 isoform X3 [Canis lupus dingo]|uniref:transmembrane protein 51 isoform X3 n=1 Tax=Canis lupus dingo TaxID=286419 RepID=UPI0006B3E409|nr:transmembrane protein 51 isoform X3 [Canis lupus dingo]|eukprot:XP_013966881.1 transmembrane protein 51 isoform X3 [Canis lupus familiaris]
MGAGCGRLGLQGQLGEGRKQKQGDRTVCRGRKADPCDWSCDSRTVSRPWTRPSHHTDLSPGRKHISLHPVPMVPGTGFCTKQVLQEHWCRGEKTETQCREGACTPPPLRWQSWAALAAGDPVAYLRGAQQVDTTGASWGSHVVAEAEREGSLTQDCNMKSCFQACPECPQVTTVVTLPARENKNHSNRTAQKTTENTTNSRP